MDYGYILAQLANIAAVQAEARAAQEEFPIGSMYPDSAEGREWQHVAAGYGAKIVGIARSIEDSVLDAERTLSAPQRAEMRLFRDLLTMACSTFETGEAFIMAQGVIARKAV